MRKTLVLALLGCLLLASFNRSLAQGAVETPAIDGRIIAERYSAVVPGSSYYLLLPDPSMSWNVSFLRELEQRVRRGLHQKGFGKPAERLLDGDVVIVLRMGLRPDRPSIDAVLAGADPDALGSTGVHHLSVTAYDIDGYARFLREHWQAAGDDASDGFMLWNAAAESRGALDDNRRHLSMLLATLMPVVGESLSARAFSGNLSAVR